MEIETSLSSPSERERWNALVDESNNGTLFHRVDFLDYHPDDRFDEHYLQFYYKGQNLMGVMPVAFSEQDGKIVARSPYGGSYGGIVVEEDVKFRYVERMVDAMIEYLTEADVDEVWIRLPPREQDRTTSAYQEFHLVNNGFEVLDNEVTHVVDLTKFDSDPFDGYEGRCRTAVRRAKDAGVEVERNPANLEDFYDLLLQTYDRHGKDPTHSLAELYDLRKRFPDRVNASVARYNGEVIAGQLGFVLNSRTHLHMYNCHSEAHRDLNAVNLLIDEEIRWSKERGLEFFDLGTSVESYDWNPGLVKFKESFGATGQFRNVYQKTL